MNKEPFGLDGKTILILGGGSGIGRETAILASKLGASIIIVGRNEDKLLSTLNELAPQGGHKYFVADLTKDEDIKTLVNQLPPLDGVVFSIGEHFSKLIKFVSREDIHKMLDITFISPVLLTKYLVRNKRIKPRGSIVYIGSISGSYNYIPGNSLYGSAKGALHSFIKFAAIEFSKNKIRCNEVCPARVETDFIYKSAFSSPEDYEKDKQKYLTKRYASPTEIAHSCIYLLSDASTFITGESIVIDGGRSLT